MQMPHLYVCGTAYQERKEQIAQANCLAYLPGVVSEEWLKETVGIINMRKKLVLAIYETATPAAVLRTLMAKAVKEIVRRGPVKEIFIEGGSTAAAVLEELTIKKLKPVNEMERGVVRMKADELFITVKPGSYVLPKEIKELYSIN